MSPPPVPPRRAPRAIIFDFDGVIADTEWLHFECFSRVLAESGIHIDSDDHDERFLGINDRAGFRKAFAEVGRRLSGKDCRSLVERKSAYYRERLGEVRLFPAVKGLLRRLSGRLPLAIASGGRSAEIGAVLQAQGIRGLFRIVLSADEVARSKPAPDCFLMALEGLRERRGTRAPAAGASEDLAPADCLVVEDTLHGIRAARAAGMRCLAVAHTYPAQKLALADRVVARLGDLRAEEILRGI